MATATPHEIKIPSAILAEDVICQSFIQSSSTLAYACLLIRGGKHDMATHVLHSLESKQAARFKDMVLYLQSQIGIETGDFAMVKRRLAPRVQQHPNDLVALSLLESCICQEWERWEQQQPKTAADSPRMPLPPGPPRPARESRWGRAGTEPEPREAAPIAFAPSAPPASSPMYRTMAVPSMATAEPIAPASEGTPSPIPSGEASLRLPELGRRRVPDPATLRNGPGPAAESAIAYDKSPAAGEGDFGFFQPLALDPNTQALSIWNAPERRLRTFCRKPELDPLISLLAQVLPGHLSAQVDALEGGNIQKVCFSFQNLTATSLHSGPENLGLVTGNINQSLLTMVRAENIFLKQGLQASGAPSQRGPGATKVERDDRAEVHVPGVPEGREDG